MAGDKMLFKNLYKEWEAYYLKLYQPKSFKGNKAIAKLYFLPIYGDTDIERMLPVNVKEWLGKANTPNQRKSFSIFLRSLFAYYYKQKGEIVNRQIIAALRTPTPRTIKKVYSYSEQKELLAKLPCTLTGLAIALLWGCGIRVSELLGLRWTDINLNDKSLQIKRCAVEGVIQQTKTVLSMRKVFIPEITLFFLLHLKSNEGYIFKAKNKNNAPMHYQTLRIQLKKTLKEIGLPFLSPHCFRVMWVTRLIENQAPPKAILEQGGWSKFNVMMDIYCQSTTYAHKKLLEVNNSFTKER